MEYYPDQTFFSQRLGQNLKLPQVGLSLEVVSCEDKGSTAAQSIFSVILRGPRPHYLPQRTYRIEGDGFEPFDLFIVPVGHDPQGIYYEAFFNRLLLPSS